VTRGGGWLRRRLLQHSIGYLGDSFTGQKTQPTVSKYWRKNAAKVKKPLKTQTTQKGWNVVVKAQMFKTKTKSVFQHSGSRSKKTHNSQQLGALVAVYTGRPTRQAQPSLNYRHCGRLKRTSWQVDNMDTLTECAYICGGYTLHNWSCIGSNQSNDCHGLKVSSERLETLFWTTRLDLGIIRLIYNPRRQLKNTRYKHEKFDRNSKPVVN